MSLSAATTARRRVRAFAALAVATAFVAAGCRDEPLAIPAKQKPAGNAQGGDEGAGGGEGGETGVAPGYGGETGTAGTTGAVGPVGGTGGASAGTAGSGGGGGPPVNLNCGNGAIDPGEQCDDGNKLSGDGCSSTCQSACETCEKNECVNYDPDFENYYEMCYSMPGRAAGGPATGVPRDELCAAVLDCVRATNCGRRNGEFGIDFVTCYCQFEVGRQDQCNDPNFVRGPCYKEFQEASEQEGIGSTLFGLLSAFGRAVGPAYRLLSSCDKYVCRDECLPEYVDEGEVTTISADISSQPNAAGESPIGNLLADAQRAAGNTDFAFVTRQAYVAGLTFEASPYRSADASGRVLWSELQAILLGYYDGENSNAGTSLLTMTLTGQLIYDALNLQLQGASYMVSGLTYTYDAATDPPVVEVRKGGVPIERAAAYTVTVDDVVRSRSSVLVMGTNVNDLAISPQKALADYLKSLPAPVAPPATDRITRLN